MTRRLSILLAVYCIALVVAAVVFEITERRGFIDSLWWAVVTATTIGYGDLSPTTPAGRLVAVLLVHLTTLGMLPLLTAEIAARLIVNNDAFTHAEQEEIKHALRRIEARLKAIDDRT